MKKCLVITFSPLKHDSRVLRQLSALSEDFEVTVCHPEPGEIYPWRQIELSSEALRKTPGLHGYLLRFGALRFGFKVIRNTLLLLGVFKLQGFLPGSQTAVARSSLRQHRFEEVDLIVANDVQTLPIAFELAGDKVPVYADLHEYSPGEIPRKGLINRSRLNWNKWVCARFLSRCRTVSVVSQTIADLYKTSFGVEPQVIPNYPNKYDIKPSRVAENSIQLVHHGVYGPVRGVEEMIIALSKSSIPATLNLVLAGAPVDQLTALVRKENLRPGQVRFHPFTAPDRLIPFLNDFDAEVIFTAPTSANGAATLPNKFFEAIQSRLAVLTGPSSEIARIVQKEDIGLVSASFSNDDLAQVFSRLNAQLISGWKKNSDQLAHNLNWETIKPKYLDFID